MGHRWDLNVVGVRPRPHGEDWPSICAAVEAPGSDLLPSDEAVFVLTSAPPHQDGVGGDVKEAEFLEAKPAVRVAGSGPHQDLLRLTELGARQPDYQPIT